MADSFARANVRLNGLHHSAYQGAVYGNPPFDGTSTHNDTINRMLNQAERACTRNTPFRGVFILPLSLRRLRERLKNPSVKLLMSFPNGTKSFIPDHYWRDGKRNAGTYNQQHTNLVLLLYRSNYDDGLLDMSIPRLQSKLAAWFLKHSPTQCVNRKSLQSTQLPMSCFHEASKSPYPREWKFWEPPTRDSTGASCDTASYPGAMLDYAHPKSEPIRDVTSLDRGAAALGFLPPTFKHFIDIISTSDTPPRRLTADISATLRQYTYTLVNKYKRLDREARVIEEHATSTQEDESHAHDYPSMTLTPSQGHIEHSTFDHLYHDDSDGETSYASTN